MMQEPPHALIHNNTLSHIPRLSSAHSQNQPMMTQATGGGPSSLNTFRRPIAGESGKVGSKSNVLHVSPPQQPRNFTERRANGNSNTAPENVMDSTRANIPAHGTGHAGLPRGSAPFEQAPNDGARVSADSHDKQLGNLLIDGPLSFPGNGHLKAFEPRSRSSSDSSNHSSGSQLPDPRAGTLAESRSRSSSDGSLEPLRSQAVNVEPAPRSKFGHPNAPTPITTNVHDIGMTSPTAHLTRKHNIAAHHPERHKPAGGQIDYESWTLDRVLQWLDDNGFSDARQIFIEHNICGSAFFALANLTVTKQVLKSYPDRFKIINTIRKLSNKPRRSSFSEKDGHPQQSPQGGGPLSPTTPTVVQNQQLPILGHQESVLFFGCVWRPSKQLSSSAVPYHIAHRIKTA